MDEILQQAGTHPGGVRPWPGCSVVLLDAGAAHGNPMGTVQGGILAALADARWAGRT